MTGTGSAYVPRGDRCRRCGQRVAAAILLLLLAFTAKGASNAVQAAAEIWSKADADRLPARNVNLPVAHHPEGTVRAMLFAARLWMPLAGPVRGEDVEVVLFDPLRNVEGVLTLTQCLLDRERQQAVGLGPLRLQYQGVDLRGTNAVWSANDQTLTFPSRSTIRFQRANMQAIRF